MYNNVAEAIKNKDYQTAQQLLHQIQKEDSDNPWFLFYTARLEEANGHLDQATQNYQKLLRQSPHPKIVSQARQGINRINELEKSKRQLAKAQRQEIFAQLQADPSNNEPGILILEPIPNELKHTAALAFAHIMDLDPYTARLHLPSRSLRLYRTGKIGEIRYYQKILQEAGIQCFSASIHEINQPKIYQIQYFSVLSPRAIWIYKTAEGKEETISFDWTEVSQRVAGLIPIFEECLEIGRKRQLERKTKILDYLQVCDLHLKTKNCIIRLCDQNLQFQKGITFSPQHQINEGKTTRDNWNQLNDYLKQQLPDVPLWSEFSPFAEMAMDFQEMLKLIDPHIDLPCQEESPWDAAFQLYSTLVFIRE